jgi:hypothetical protein
MSSLAPSLYFTGYLLSSLQKVINDYRASGIAPQEAVKEEAGKLYSDIHFNGRGDIPMNLLKMKWSYYAMCLREEFVTWEDLESVGIAASRRAVADIESTHVQDMPTL